MNKQVEYYATVYGNLAAQLGSAKVVKLVAKSLFVLVIGSDDLFSYFKSNSKLQTKYTPQQYIDLLISTFKAQLEVICNQNMKCFKMVCLIKHSTQNSFNQQVVVIFYYFSLVIWMMLQFFDVGIWLTICRGCIRRNELKLKFSFYK